VVASNLLSGNHSGCLLRLRLILYGEHTQRVRYVEWFLMVITYGQWAGSQCHHRIDSVPLCVVLYGSVRYHEQLCNSLQRIDLVLTTIRRRQQCAGSGCRSRPPYIGFLPIGVVLYGSGHVWECVHLERDVLVGS